MLCSAAPHAGSPTLGVQFALLYGQLPRVLVLTTGGYCTARFPISHFRTVPHITPEKAARHACRAVQYKNINATINRAFQF